MAKVTLHPALLEFRGAMGDMVFKKRNGKIYVSMKPKRDETREPSQAQLACREVFKHASEYAKFAMADETRRAFYEALADEKGMTAHAPCVGDYLNQPTIDELDLSGYQGQIGDHILITICDDVGVVHVDVTLTNINGTTIEKGQALEQGTGSGYWEYVATVPIPLDTEVFIEAEAYDRPGHRAVASANSTVTTKY